MVNKNISLRCPRSDHLLTCLTLSLCLFQTTVAMDFLAPSVQAQLQILLDRNILIPDDLDERILQELKGYPEEHGVAIAKEFSSVDRESIRNVPSYLVGISRRVPFQGTSALSFPLIFTLFLHLRSSLSSGRVPPEERFPPAKRPLEMHVSPSTPSLLLASSSCLRMMDVVVVPVVVSLLHTLTAEIATIAAREKDINSCPRHLVCRCPSIDILPRARHIFLLPIVILHLVTAAIIQWTDTLLRTFFRRTHLRDHFIRHHHNICHHLIDTRLLRLTINLHLGEDIRRCHHSLCP
jgi:hypothetical protein